MLESGNDTTTIKLNNILRYDHSEKQTEVRLNNINKNKRQIEHESQHRFSNDAECGTLALGSVQSLSIGGEAVVRGEWPW